MAESTQVDESLRIQMEESREALAQKIELLEEKVTETVQATTASMAEATANVMETVQTATATVSDTVDSVTNAVQGTVDTVCHSVEDTVDSVKEAFDLSHQVKQHPWLMMGGAVAVGFIGGMFSRPARGSMFPTRTNPPDSSLQASNGHSEPRQSAPYRTSNEPLNNSVNAAVEISEPKAVPTGPTFLGQLGEAFGSEIGKLESLAVGALLGAARDMIVDAVPPALQKQVEGIVDDFTEKLGGQRIPGHAFSSDSLKQTPA